MVSVRRLRSGDDYILFPVLYDHAEGIEMLVSQTSSRFNAQKVLASAA